jgi:hypothetical protein
LHWEQRLHAGQGDVPLRFMVEVADKDSVKERLTDSDGLVMNRPLFESLAPIENSPNTGHFIRYGARSKLSF